MSDLRYYDLLARAFLQEGVTTCFALLGDANMCFTTRLAEAGCGAIYVRHEHCAVAAAMSYARATGSVGVASITCGPGLTQTMTALAGAAVARIPLVVFAGEAPLGKAWYNQKIDQPPFALAAGASYRALHHPERMTTEVRDAFLEAMRERKPVVVGVPFDLQDRPCPADAPLPVPARDLLPATEPLAPHPDAIARAAAMIAEAGRVVVVAGRGAVASGAGPAARALAERTDGLVGTTLPVRGFFRDDPFSLGIVGGYATDAAKAELATADLVVAAGCSLAHHTTMGGSLFPDAQVLQIDLDPVATSQGNVAARHHLRADARLALEALAGAVPERPARWRSAELAARLASAAKPASDIPPEPGVHDPRAAVAALQEALPLDWDLVNTSGHISAFTVHMPGRPHDRFHTIREFGAIGNGTAFALGVAAARPAGSPVVLLDGDGSLMMHIQELETIARQGLKVLVVAFNDGAYSSETHKLKARGLSLDGARFGRPDFAAVGCAFGLDGEAVTDLAALPALAERFAASDHGCVWDIPISENVLSPTMKRLVQAATAPNAETA